MAAQHRFGGDWTEEKLDRLRKYLCEYTKIFTKNPRASKLRTTYVDAFAGTGYRDALSSPLEERSQLFGDPDATSFKDGSAHIALQIEPGFDNYLFVERNPDHVHALEDLRQRFPDKRGKIIVVQKEANRFLQAWCQETDWAANRAVVFLDPYGMEVEWVTIEAIAETKAIDLWLLFPLGQAVNRLLTKKGPPPDHWADRLTKCFGTNAWRNAFYRHRRQKTFSDEEDACEKDADFEAIGRFFVERLRTAFEGVAENPLPLRNSRNVPIFLLCFAAGNAKGAPIAVRIASHILGK